MSAVSTSVIAKEIVDKEKLKEVGYQIFDLDDL